VTGTVEETFVIAEDTNDQFSVSVDAGAAQTITIPPDTYTAADLADVIDGLTTGIDCSDSSGYLRITHETLGEDHTIEILAVDESCYTTVGLTAAETDNGTDNYPFSEVQNGTDDSSFKIYYQNTPISSASADNEVEVDFDDASFDPDNPEWTITVDTDQRWFIHLTVTDWQSGMESDISRMAFHPGTTPVSGSTVTGAGAGSMTTGSGDGIAYCAP
jgi:hypothetical protein